VGERGRKKKGEGGKRRYLYLQVTPAPRGEGKAGKGEKEKKEKKSLHSLLCREKRKRREPTKGESLSTSELKTEDRGKRR